MASDWLNQFIKHRNNETPPVTSGKIRATLDLHGLNARDALDVVERKLNRALRTGAVEIWLLHDEKDRKLKRSLHEFLASRSVVEEITCSDESPGIITVHLRQPFFASRNN